MQPPALSAHASCSSPCGQLGWRVYVNRSTKLYSHTRRKTRQQRCMTGRPAVAQLSLETAAGVGDLADAAIGTGVAPVIGLGVALAGLAAVRFSAYSQLEYITAAMLARHVKAGGARVLQLGGTTRDLYYYPKGTVQVTVVGPGLKTGLWEQAGMQAQIPVVPRSQPPSDSLLFLPDASQDSVVLLNTLAPITDVAKFCSEVFRVLRPGGTFVFIQRVRGGALQPLVLGGPRVVAASTVDMVSEFPRWDYVKVDPALEQQDLHAVGVAVKPLVQQQGGDNFSVDKSAFEQMMKSASRGRKASGGSGGGGAGSQGFGARN